MIKGELKGVKLRTPCHSGSRLRNFRTLLRHSRADGNPEGRRDGGRISKTAWLNAGNTPKPNIPQNRHATHKQIRKVYP